MHQPKIDPTKHAALRPRAALEVAVVGNLRLAGRVGDTSIHRADGISRALREQAEAACEKVWTELADGMTKSLQTQVGPMIPHAKPKNRNRKCSQTGKHECSIQKDVEHCEYELRAFFNAEAPRVGILSSLTSGLGLIAAKSAVVQSSGGTLQRASRHGVEFELEAALPFAAMKCGQIAGIPCSEYLQAEVSELEDLLGQSPSTGSNNAWLRQVMRMDGLYEPPSPAKAGVGDAETAKHRFKTARKLAYRSAAEMMVQNADLMVAVKDPTDAAGAAELQEILELALGSSVPVLLIDLHEDRTEFHLYDRLPASLGAPPPSSAPWEEVLRKKVEYLMALPQMIVPENEKCHERVKRQEMLAQTVDRLLRLYGDRPEHSICDCKMRMPILKASWRWLQGVSKMCVGWPHGHSNLEEPKEERHEMKFPVYEKWYVKGSLLASSYMSVYRGFFILSFFLAAVAVAIAVLAVSLALYYGHDFPAWGYALAPIKGGILLLLLAMSNASHHNPPQELAADFRYFTEVLRPMEWLAPLGASMPTVELSPHHRPQDPRQGWTQWLLRAISRSTPSAINQQGRSEEVVLDSTAARDTLTSAANVWISSQIHYHYWRAQKMHHLENGLVRINKGLLYVVLAAVAIIFSAEMFSLVGEFAFHSSWHLDHQSWQMVILGALTATLPAFIAALTGILFQSEAAALELQSEAMFLQLRETKEDLLKMVNQISTRSPPDSLGCEAWKAAQHLRNVARMMIIETGDWRAMYQLHEVHAG